MPKMLLLLPLLLLLLMVGVEVLLRPRKQRHCAYMHWLQKLHGNKQLPMQTWLQRYRVRF
jgi:hypothetical protein